MNIQRKNSVHHFHMQSEREQTLAKVHDFISHLIIMTGYHELTDEEIVAYTRDVDGDKESEDDEGESPPMVSHSEACCALETVLAYLEQQPGVPVPL